MISDKEHDEQDGKGHARHEQEWTLPIVGALGFLGQARQGEVPSDPCQKRGHRDANTGPPSLAEDRDLSCVLQRLASDTAGILRRHKHRVLWGTGRDGMRGDLESDRLSGRWHLLAARFDLMGESRLQLQRAQDQLAKLKASIDAWMELRPYHLVTEFDFVSAQNVQVFRILADPPVVWAQEVADLSNNFRSALNIAVHAIAEPDSDDIGYPIYRVKTEYWHDRPNARKPIDRLSPRDYYLAGVADDYRTVIDATQPYHAGDEAKAHPLAMLAHLANTNKHRRLEMALAVPKTGTIRLTPLSAHTRFETMIIKPGVAIKDGTIVARYTVEPPTEVAVESQFSVAVSFGQWRINSGALRGVEAYVVKIIERLAAIQVETA